MNLSCNDDNKNISENSYSKLLNSTTTTINHRWFYFTNTGFLETQSPSLAPDKVLEPWTEKPRITSGTIINGQVFFTVNKLGILVCPAVSGLQSDGISSQTYLVKDSSLFTNYTAGNMYCINDKPAFNLYTNTIFDKNQNHDTNSIPILIEFNPLSNEFKTLLYKNDFVPSNEAIQFEDLNLNSLQYINKKWYASFKNSLDNQTTILFTKTYSNEPENIKSLSTTTACKKINQEEFRERTEPTPFSIAPKKIQDLLYMIPKTTPFYIRYLEDSDSNTTVFSQSTKQGDVLEGYAMSTTDCSLAVFADGTTYFAGKLPYKAVLKNGKTIAFKLPLLPDNYIYGYSFIAGSNLYVSWEEHDFYKTGKSGFIVVNLEEILYNGE
ncbi:MAG: hypothetical protein BKP49_06050 [Treponema sp. CETP13]|nr:MAG: hypothetical protein BKP49_06050 [Treponema sp. CETP13]